MYARRLFLVLCSLLCLAVVPSPGQASDSSRTLLVLGDSISAAYGMSLEQGWVALLARRLESQGSDINVVNASISGETSGGALARLPELLQEHTPDLVVLELGGNDGLRGFPINRLRDNLTEMTQLSQQAGAQVVLVTMEIPPNYGPRYTQAFRDSFARVAAENDATVAPFFLEGVGTDPSLMQDDGIHPTIAAQELLLNNIWPTLEGLLAP